ncbi:uncharacterized protein GIQ15_04023 [Arthroderma uncinatum]|uniref:uncharacterized protein n=1 Tax=Arthroderma uncinatum TaxID=74035 RepID=UPI00144ADDEF|nr:uncharacterized protein GIQ15_04023 [Arthroderma uncinatum]KAF3481264.1 hypothetical protein GIQ15_04023 [Arthroderma uncinatum]
MGQRHNRRRTRPRSRRRMNNNAPSRPPAAPQDSYTLPVHTLPPPLSCSPAARYHCHDRVPSAQLWHNRYMAWQGRSGSISSTSSTASNSPYSQQDSAKLEAEQCRLFGGEPGDDVALCYRMLEFFGGLDFIQ